MLRKYRAPLAILLLLAFCTLGVAGCSGGAGAGILVPFGSTGGAGGGAGGGGGGGGVAQFLFSLVTMLTQLSNPFHAVEDFSPMNPGNVIGQFWVEGFNLGANNGKLRYGPFAIDVNTGQLSFATVPVTFTLSEITTGVAGGPVLTLTSPTGFDSDAFFVTGVTRTAPLQAARLFLCDGYGTTGRIIIVSNINRTLGTASAVNLIAEATAQGQVPAPLPPQNPLSIAFVKVQRPLPDGTTLEYLFWTEYVGSGLGKIRRARLSPAPVRVEDFMTGLTFPAEIDHNVFGNPGLPTNQIMFAETGGNRYILVNIEPTDLAGALLPLPLNPDQLNAGILRVRARSTTAQPILRAYNIRALGGLAFLCADGFGLIQGNGPGASGLNNGAIRIFRGSFEGLDAVLDDIKLSVTNPVSAEVFVNAAGQPLGILFLEAADPTGTLKKLTVTFGANLQGSLAITLEETLANALRSPIKLLNGVDSATNPLHDFTTVLEGFNQGLNNGKILGVTDPRP